MCYILTLNCYSFPVSRSQVDPMYISSEISGVSLVPDVSRVTLAAPLVSKISNQNVSQAYLSRDRTIT